MTATTALTTIQNAAPPSADEWRIFQEQAKMLVSTSFLPQSIKTPEQAIAIILQGRELGIPTMAALGTINVIQGKPTVSPQLMLALINRSGQLENIEITNNPDGVSCTMTRRGRTPHTEVFGAREAAAMGLNGKDNYKKQALTMYRWRAVAACARVVFPDVILGFYTPDEMGAETNANGEFIEPSQPTTTDLIGEATVIEPPSAEEITEIENLSMALGEKDSTIAAQINWLKSASPEDRQKGLNKLLLKSRVFIKQKISSADWGLTEDGTAEFLESHGIENGIDNADAPSLTNVIAALGELVF